MARSGRVENSSFPDWTKTRHSMRGKKQRGERSSFITLFITLSDQEHHGC